MTALNSKTVATHAMNKIQFSPNEGKCLQLHSALSFRGTARQMHNLIRARFSDYCVSTSTWLALEGVQYNCSALL